MSLSSPVITGQVVGHPVEDLSASSETGAVLLAQGLLEEVYRRREAIGFSLVLLLCLLAAAVGLRVWSLDGNAATALESPDFSVPSASSDPITGGPSGTWQRFGDLGSQKRSQSPAAVPSGTSTTTFSATPDAPGAGVVSPTTTTAQPGSS